MIADAERTPSSQYSLCLRPGARQQGSQFGAAGGSGFQHRPIDVAFDGAYRQCQSLGDFAAGQSRTSYVYKSSANVDVSTLWNDVQTAIGVIKTIVDLIGIATG
jgi:hypothetical protein